MNQSHTHSSDTPSVETIPLPDRLEPTKQKAINLIQQSRCIFLLAHCNDTIGYYIEGDKDELEAMVSAAFCQPENVGEILREASSLHLESFFSFIQDNEVE